VVITSAIFKTLEKVKDRSNSTNSRTSPKLTVDGLDGANSIAVSPEGRQVYVASQFDDALAVFSRDPISGALTLAGVHKNGENGVTGLNTANGIAVSPTGSHIYVSGFDDNAVAVFSRFDISLPLIMKEP
jgi:DNA-binding beta-propeller fold protein YncE